MYAAVLRDAADDDKDLHFSITSPVWKILHYTDNLCTFVTYCHFTWQKYVRAMTSGNAPVYIMKSKSSPPPASSSTRITTSFSSPFFFV